MLKIPPKSTVLFIEMQFARRTQTLWVSSLAQLVCSNFRRSSSVQASHSLVQASRSFKSFACSNEPFARSSKSFIQVVRSFKRAVRLFIKAVWSFSSPVSNGIAIHSKIFVSRSPVHATRSEYLRAVCCKGRLRVYKIEKTDFPKNCQNKGLGKLLLKI